MFIRDVCCVRLANLCALQIKTYMRPYERYKCPSLLDSYRFVSIITYIVKKNNVFDPHVLIRQSPGFFWMDFFGRVQFTSFSRVIKTQRYIIIFWLFEII